MYIYIYIYMCILVVLLEVEEDGGDPARQEADHDRAEEASVKVG